MKNYGVLIGEKPGDYHADLVGGALPFISNVQDGIWRPWLPDGERQSSDNGDSMSCVTFGHLNSIETQEKHQTGIQPNYSDRWIAKMSNTTRKGNYLSVVADTIRKYGLVLESSYPTPSKYTWDEYHADIPEPLLSKLKSEGQEWLKRWDVKYEWVDIGRESLMKHIQQAPLSVIIPGHLVVNFHTTQDVIKYFDSYKPWEKETKQIQNSMKVVLYPRDQAVPDEHLLVDIKYLDSGKQFEKLRAALIKLGWLDANLPAYNEAFAKVVLNFQKANLSHMSWAYWYAIMYYRGKLVDAATREAINSALDNKK